VTSNNIYLKEKRGGEKGREGKGKGKKREEGLRISISTL